MALSADHPRLEDAIGLLDRLIAFPTVSFESNLELINEAAGWLEAAGADVRVWHCEDGTRANCLATIGPQKDAASGKGGIMLSGHSDVVPVTGQSWTSDPFAMDRRDGRLYGRGTCDMKGFIAAAIAMASDFATLPLARPVHIALTYDEETGCLGGRQLVRDMAAEGIRPAVCIVGEPTSMRIIEGHKGCYEYTTRFTGLAAHGSLTHQGVNAIEYAARYITRLMDIREQLKNSTPAGQRFEPPYTTLQIGRIEGGVSRNTIAGDCAVEWEMRPVQTEDANHVKAEINRYVEEELLPQMRQRAPEAAIETEVIGEVTGLEPASESEARDICAALTGSAQTDVVSFGTEAGLYQEMGTSTVVCGPGSIEQAHKPDEYIEIAELGRCLNMLEGLKARLTA
ncbi:MAG: acetylornithine deacetylase [Phyllobacteriaceae bacterium]|nr:acetylornithine deacetylase [Phyllobacteriaceae bacterium]